MHRESRESHFRHLSRHLALTGGFTSAYLGRHTVLKCLFDFHVVFSLRLLGGIRRTLAFAVCGLQSAWLSIAHLPTSYPWLYLQSFSVSLEALLASQHADVLMMMSRSCSWAGLLKKMTTVAVVFGFTCLPYIVQSAAGFALEACEPFPALAVPHCNDGILISVCIALGLIIGSLRSRLGRYHGLLLYLAMGRLVLRLSQLVSRINAHSSTS